MLTSTVTFIGAYTPERIITNEYLESIVDTSDEWIKRRTGVIERRKSAPDEYTSHLAIRAVEDLMQKSGQNLDDVDMIIVTTFTPDHLAPHVAALVHGHFKMGRAGTMDISAGCTGFIYAFQVADSLIRTGQFRKILLISSETITKVTDYSDRDTCVLFGDAAVAMMIEADESRQSNKTSYFDTNGQMAPNIYCSNLSDQIVNNAVAKPGIFSQTGRQVYEYVLKNVPTGIKNLLSKAELNVSDIDWFIPHSANVRMTEALCHSLDFPLGKTILSNQYFGNTSSATIPLSLWIGQNKALFKRGDKLLLYGFGAGITQGGIILEW